MNILARCPGLLFIAGFLAACSDDSADLHITEPAKLPTGVVEIQSAGDTLALAVEIAETNTARAYGLMDRDVLDPRSGMLFTFDIDEPPDHAFYMFRTRIPLDIAFAEAEGEIVSVMTMQPCDSPYPRYCHRYSPGIAYRYVLEANAGYFASNGVEVGDRLVLVSRPDAN